MDEKLITELKGRLWHATNEQAYQKIMQDRRIRPDAEATYANGFCRGIGAISLFDLARPDPPPPASHWSQWISRNPLTPSYWFEVDRKLSESAIVEPELLRERWKNEHHNDALRIIAGIESAHIGSIPIDHISQIIEIRFPDWKTLSPRRSSSSI